MMEQRLKEKQIKKRLQSRFSGIAVFFLGMFQPLILDQVLPQQTGSATCIYIGKRCADQTEGIGEEFAKHFLELADDAL